MPTSTRETSNLTRRGWLAATGAGTAALMLKHDHLQAHQRSGAGPGMTRDTQEGTVVFTNTTVANPDAVQDDVALAVEGDRIAAIGPTDEVVAQYPRAEQYDGRGKALFPGLINTHAHMRAVIARGFNEDFGFPNTAGLAVSPASLLEGEEGNLMVQVAALEAIRTGTTTIVEYTGNVQRQAAVLADSGLRCVLAEGIRDAENVPGPMSTRAIARAVSETPRFSARLRDEGLQRISDLFTTWHAARNGRVSVFPAAALTETSSPELLRAVREFAETHDLGYTIHLNQSRAEYEFMVMHHGLRSGSVPRPARLPRPPAVCRPRPLRQHRRGHAAGQVRHHHRAPGGDGREPRHQPAHSGAAGGRLPHRPRHRQQHQRRLRGDAHRHADRADPPQPRRGRGARSATAAGGCPGRLHAGRSAGGAAGRHAGHADRQGPESRQEIT